VTESRLDQPLAEESPVALVLNGKRLSTFMCTPQALDELAVGHLKSRGLIENRESIKRLLVCPDRGSIYVDAFVHNDASEDEGIIASSCGSGIRAVELLGCVNRLPVDSSWIIALSKLRDWSKHMFAEAELYRSTGGVHCAALRGENGFYSMREDVGRHNAVDKIIGRGIFDGLDFSQTALLTSGRIAADMVLKAWAVGIPVLASRSIPTTSAYELALTARIALIGRIGTANAIIYSSRDRIKTDSISG